MYINPKYFLKGTTEEASLPLPLHINAVKEITLQTQSNVPGLTNEIEITTFKGKQPNNGEPYVAINLDMKACPVFAFLKPINKTYMMDSGQIIILLEHINKAISGNYLDTGKEFFTVLDKTSPVIKPGAPMIIVLVQAIKLRIDSRGKHYIILSYDNLDSKLLDTVTKHSLKDGVVSNEIEDMVSYKSTEFFNVGSVYHCLNDKPFYTINRRKYPLNLMNIINNMEELSMANHDRKMNIARLVLMVFKKHISYTTSYFSEAHISAVNIIECKYGKDCITVKEDNYSFDEFRIVKLFKKFKTYTELSDFILSDTFKAMVIGTLESAKEQLEENIKELTPVLPSKMSTKQVLSNPSVTSHYTRINSLTEHIKELNAGISYVKELETNYEN